MDLSIWKSLVNPLVSPISGEWRWQKPDQCGLSRKISYEEVETILGDSVKTCYEKQTYRLTGRTYGYRSGGGGRD